MDDSCAAAPLLESLRIQAAAVVAQQAAVGERELRLVEREAALARQEEQLAGRLEDQRRQLLDLQDQITEARSALREKRAAHATLAQQQQQELTTAREEAAESLRSAKAVRQRLTDLRRRLIQRGRRHWQARRKEAETRDARLRKQADQLAAERADFVVQVERFNGQAELDKRRLRDSWGQFERERREWQDRRTIEMASAETQTRDLSRRAKAIAAAERKIAADRTALAGELAGRRRELEQLETRIGNARLRLLEQQAALLDTRHETRDPRQEDDALVSRVSCLVSLPTETGSIFERRATALAIVADELADQRLLLTEQVERLLLTQQQWHADKTAALRDLELIGSRFEARELDLDRRGREVQVARAAVRAEYQAAAQLRLRLEAERARSEARDAERRIVLDARWAELEVRERALIAQEDNWHSLLRRWGKRRRMEIQRLRSEHQACRSERGEWVAARTVWLRLTARLREERRSAAARELAVEQWRVETANDPVAAKRLERLQRQWSSQCQAMARDLGRLQATLATEAARVDEVSRRVRQDAIAAESRSAVLDDRAAEVEREEQLVAAERARIAGELDVGRVRQDAAEQRVAELRDEAERLARLLIDTAPIKTEAHPSQAA
jgi:hypothetical protein